MYVDRRKKVESGQRTTSLHWMLKKPGLVSNVLSTVKPENRELYFMLGQFGEGNLCRFFTSYSQRVNVQAYAVLTDVPAVFVLYDSPFWSGAYLLFILSVSVWNGGGFYIEVFGRKYVRCSHGTISYLTIWQCVGSNVSWKHCAKSWRKHKANRNAQAQYWIRLRQNQSPCRR